MNTTTSNSSGLSSDSTVHPAMLVEFRDRLVHPAERERVLANERLIHNARDAAKIPWSIQMDQERDRLRSSRHVLDACPKEWAEITAELKVLVGYKEETLLHPYYPLAGKLMHDEAMAKEFFGDPTPVWLVRVAYSADKDPRCILVKSKVAPSPGDRLLLRSFLHLALHDHTTEQGADLTLAVMWAVPRISEDLFWRIGPGAFALGDIYGVREESVMAFKPRH